MWMGKFVTMFSEDRHNFRAGQNDTLMESVLAKAIKPGFAFELSPSPPIKQTIKCQLGYFKKKKQHRNGSASDCEKGPRGHICTCPFAGGL